MKRAARHGTRSDCLEHDVIRRNRHHAPVLCLSMVSAQTRSAFVAKENQFPTMLYAAATISAWRSTRTLRPSMSSRIETRS
jgi:hypothetical protein